MRRRSFFLGFGSALALAPYAVGAADIRALRRFTPEMFGAKGDGRTNDTLAFQALAKAVNEAGGGEILFRRTTYVVGRQSRPAKIVMYSLMPDEILHFLGCTGDLVLRGNGATLKCAPGLRYGTFDADTGEATNHPMPYRGRGELASPYQIMIKIEKCAGRVEVYDLELDGNVGSLRLGGRYGDIGTQIPADGLALFENRGPELVRNLYTHHHAMDGLYIDGVDEDINVPRRIENVRSEYNGRQGCSLVGGRGYSFENCRFRHIGRGPVFSPPGAGIDIEAEKNKKIRRLTFHACEFSDCRGVGMLADSGDSDTASFVACTFIGTTAWSAWPLKPHFHFQSCRFIGAMVHAYGDKDPERAAQFHDCVWLDDPALSPTGQIYLAGRKNSPIADLSSSMNARFVRCSFNMTHGGLLPWSWKAIYQDCRMSQAAPVIGYPKGKYLGTSVINGKVDLYGTHVIGTLILNGKTLRNVQLGGTDW
ncbi:MAG TPA: hypothetical protein VFW19_16510 [Allosphingosinicella sp.]|nr:hypothetical protein [Allosphingosinicella sp.]